jgi:UDP-2,3-diacylglucosamine pyrophosphatase LpxH
VHDIWNNLVDQFLQLDFVKKYNHWKLEMGLRLSTGFSYAQIQQLLQTALAKKIYSRSEDYRGFAYDEWALPKNQARYVVYGHTHHAEQVPLDSLPPSTSGTTEALYFNTGTWRQVFEHTVFDPNSCEFIGWIVDFLFISSRKKQELNGITKSVRFLGYGRV